MSGGNGSNHALSSQATSGRALAIACAIFLTYTLAMFGDVIFGGGEYILSGGGDDIAGFFLHWYRFGFEALRNGDLVLWNPHLFSGTPYFGAFQPALLYPPNWLYTALPLGTAVNLNVALHCFIMALAMYLWAAHRRLHPTACILSGLVFMLSGPIFLQIFRGHLPNLYTIAWTPLVFLAVDGALRTGRFGWVLLGAMAVAMQIFAGHVQYIFYTALILGLYAGIRWLREDRRPRTAVALLAIYPAGACLAAIQLLTGWQAVSESLRTGITFEVARTFAFPPENLLTLVIPGIFGDLIVTPYWGRWTLSEMSLFIGTAPFLLVLYAVVHAPRNARRYLLALAVISLVLAFGYYTPLFRVLYDFAPGFGRFRGIYKFTYLTALFIALLAGIGFDQLLKDGRRHRWPAVFALAAALVLVAAGWAVSTSAATPGGQWSRWLASIDTTGQAYEPYPVDRTGDFAARAGANAARYLYMSGASFLMVGSLWWLSRKRHAVTLAIAAFGVMELFAYARFSRPAFDPAPLIRQFNKLKSFAARKPGDYRVLSINPNIAMSAGVHDVWGYDPMILRRYAEFIAFTLEKNPSDLIARPLPSVSPLLGLLRLRYVHELHGTHARVFAPGFRELPRAALIPQWRVIEGQGALLEAMTDPSFDPLRTVLLEEEPALATAESQRAEEVGSVSVVDLSTDAMEVSADVRRPAVLLISDNYSTGWNVMPLNEAPQPHYRLLPADATLRGIPLNPGRHHLRLEYRPTAFVAGKWITVVSLAIYVVCVCVWAWRRTAGRPLG